MQPDIQTWDKAEQHFLDWLNGSGHEKNLHTDILKSMFMSLRKNLQKEVHIKCKNAFGSFLQKRNNENMIRESEILFSRSELFCDRKTDIQKLFEETEIEDDSEEILKALVKGRQTVFDHLYICEFPRIERYVIQNSGTSEKAQDLFQDAIVILLEKYIRKEISFSGSYSLDQDKMISAWLFGISKNLWHEELRKQKKEQAYKNEVTGDADNHFCDIPDLKEPDIFGLVNNALHELGGTCRKLIECYYYRQMNWDDIAGYLGYASAASARNQKYKCLEKIRREIKVDDLEYSV